MSRIFYRLKEDCEKLKKLIQILEEELQKSYEYIEYLNEVRDTDHDEIRDIMKDVEESKKNPRA